VAPDDSQINNSIPADDKAKSPATILYKPPSPIRFCIGMATCESTQPLIPRKNELVDTAEALRPCHQHPIHEHSIGHDSRGSRRRDMQACWSI